MATTRQGKVLEISRFFGGRLDKEVVESVLDVCNDNLQEAVHFLQVQNGDQQHEPQQGPFEHQSGNGPRIPHGYFTKPEKWVPIPDQNSLEKRTQHAHFFRQLFLDEKSSLENHFKCSTDDQLYHFYVAVFLLLLEHGTDISNANKAKALAAIWTRRDFNTSNYILSKFKDAFSVVVILRAVKILDAPRKIKTLEAKLAKSKKRRKNAGLLQEINKENQNLVPSYIAIPSFTKALVKQVKRWCKSIPKEQLEFFALQYPKEPWQELSDICHLNPHEDFQLDYFLHFVFGRQPPVNSIVVACQNLTIENAQQVVRQFRIPYSYLRKRFPIISREVKLAVADYESLDTLLWWYEELSTTPDGKIVEFDEIIAKKLKEQKSSLELGYGKLIERLLLFKQQAATCYQELLPITEQKLENYALPLEPTVVVCGDASFSMDIAIRTSMIISSMIVALTQGSELVFFNTKPVSAPFIPKNAAQVVQLSQQMKADGLTAPACVLWHYYNEKKPIRTFIMCTDEIENEQDNQYFFPQLFYKYYTEVFPARIVFVSFRDNPQVEKKGRMVNSLENLGIIPLVFSMDAHHPDLTKLDNVIAMLSSEGNLFGQQTLHLANLLLSKKGEQRVNEEKCSMEQMIKETLSLKFEKEKKKDSTLPPLPTFSEELVSEKYRQTSKRAKRRRNVSTHHNLGAMFQVPDMHQPQERLDGLTWPEEADDSYFEHHSNSPSRSRSRSMSPPDRRNPSYRTRSRSPQPYDTPPSRRRRRRSPEHEEF